MERVARERLVHVEHPYDVEHTMRAFEESN